MGASTRQRPQTHQQASKTLVQNTKQFYLISGSTSTAEAHRVGPSTFLILLSSVPATQIWLLFSAMFPPTEPNLVPRSPSANSSIHHLLSVYLYLLPFFAHCHCSVVGCSPAAIERSQQWPFSVPEHRSKRNADLK